MELKKIIEEIRAGKIYYLIAYSYNFHNLVASGYTEHLIQPEEVKFCKIPLKTSKSEISDLDIILYLGNKPFKVVEQYRGYIYNKEFDRDIARQSKKIVDFTEFLKIIFDAVYSEDKERQST
ncbi:MAG: hypothetical protein NC915_06795 [Candidatus Omnitrophica bacterium]|nr:hypothetical protein [Candidatus Omnitrophota bacterium]